ncbi:hypothetical protein [Aliamphritea spongicola]|nr:hypothetical protein [Aliamphritea spongicola]
MTEGLSIVLAILLALLLDYRFQEPRSYHPLVGFGNLAIWLEKHLNRYRHGSQGRLPDNGGVFWPGVWRCCQSLLWPVCWWTFWR